MFIFLCEQRGQYRPSRIIFSYSDCNPVASFLRNKKSCPFIWAPSVVLEPFLRVVNPSESNRGRQIVNHQSGLIFTLNGFPRIWTCHHLQPQRGAVWCGQLGAEGTKEVDRKRVVIAPLILFLCNVLFSQTISNMQKGEHLYMWSKIKRCHRTEKSILKGKPRGETKSVQFTWPCKC